LLLCFACSPGTDMHDAPSVLAGGVGFAITASLACVAWVVLATSRVKQRDDNSSHAAIDD
jgi:hypothetical protein